MGVTFGLIAALCWGATDFLAGGAARLIGVRKAVLVSNLVGFAALAVFFLFSSEAHHRASSASIAGYFSAITAAACSLSGSLSLSRGLATGKSAVVAPIAMSYGAVTTILSLLSGETFEKRAILGIVICLAGVPLTAMSGRHEPLVGQSRGSEIFFAVLAALLYGVSFWIQGEYALPQLGATLTLLTIYAFGCAALALSFVGRGRMLPLARLESIPLLLGQAFASLAALGSFAIGATLGSTATVTVLSTLSGGVTALLGFLLRHERLTTAQWIGVLAVIAGATALKK